MSQALAMPSQETAQAFGTEIARVLPQVQDMRATDAQTSEACSAALRALVTRRAQIDEERKKVTGPLNVALRTINSWFKPVDDRFADAEKHLRAEIGGYAQRTEQARRLAMVQATQGAPAPMIPIPQHAEAAGTSTRLVWKWRIVDASAVPRELCSPDPTKIQTALSRLAVGTIEIPGVEWYEEAQVIARRIK